ncbi:MAG: hypothetical protein Q4G52_12905 [Clostridia bacterium]|nr:hypothetical protein [Clostridia bacterium]
MLSRLRAALTPQVIILMAAALALMAGSLFLGQDAGAQSTELEKRIARTLSAMEGAGQVRVVIMTREQEKSAETGFRTSGAAQQVPCGAIAVAQGADDPLVNIRLTQSLCALLGLPASSVSVVTGGF